MPIEVESLLEVLVEICQEMNLRVAACESLKGGLMAGSSAVLGGLILGPLGLAVGGAIGGIVAAKLGSGKFKPVGEILTNMPANQKQLLCNKIQRAFSDVGYQDIVTITMLILSNKNLKELALKEVINFMSKEMNLNVMT